MARILEGETRGAGRRIAVAVADFNADVTAALLQGCLGRLRALGVREDDVLVVHVPGAFELPLCCDRLAASGGYAAVVALGAVIRGETPHFEHVAAECARGVARVALDRGVPVIFGVLTTDTLEQARRRAELAPPPAPDPGARAAKTARPSNKGAEAAEAALRMIAALERI